MTDTIDTKPDGTEAYFGPVTRKGAESVARPSTPEEASTLEPGRRFLDPTGKERTVPYRPQTPEDVESIPEGAHFVDPQGVLREKPKYEGIDFTAQTLYDMAVNDKERQKALERSYPGKVKKKPTGEFYVEDEGTLRRPHGMTESSSGFAAGMLGQAAPTVGSILGDVGGAAAGSPTGPGAVIPAIAGGAAGGAAGQAFNDGILQLAGVYDRTGGEEAEELGLSAAFGGVGTAVGRVVAGAGPAAKGQLLNTAPKLVAKALGAGENPGALEMGIALREKGVDLLPTEEMFPEAPHLANVTGPYFKAFHLQNPMKQRATAHYEKNTGEILEGLGAKPAEGESISKPKAAVSTEEAGVKVLAKAREESSAADAELRKQLDLRKGEASAKAALGEIDQGATREGLAKAEKASRQAAEKIINEGFQSIQTDIDTAMKATKAGANSGDLWWSVGEKLKQVKQGIGARAKKMYGEADELAGGHLPDTSGLSETAKDFLGQLPEGFEGKYPSIVKQLRDLAGVENEAGEIIKPPVQPTFGQLHNLRSIMRQNINYLDLTPDIREGVYKFFAKHVDDILHDPHARPELKEAARALDNADAFYRENMGPLNDRNIQAVMNGLESGMPADPKILYNTLIKEGRSDLTRKVRDLVGQTLWAGIKAADMQEMLDSARSLVPGQIDGRKFAQQVLDRYRSGMLEAVHDPKAVEKLIAQAQNVAMLDGKLDIAIRPGDSVAEVIAKARSAAEAAKAAGKADPLSTLNKEMKAIQREHSQNAAKMQAQRRNDPLGFLYDLKTGASAAVDRILGSEDLIIAAAAKFGEGSPEFQALRQVYAKRLLQGTLQPSKGLAGVSEEVQRMMFPGVTLDQMKTLAKEMDFLMASKASNDTAKSMAAQTMVNHPWGTLGENKSVVRAAIKETFAAIPFSDFAARAALAKYFKMVTTLASKPWFLRFVEKGLKGDEIARERTKEAVQRAMRMGGALGAGLGESTEQQQWRFNPGEDNGDTPPLPGAKRAPDGNHYIPDPARPGKYFRVDRGSSPDAR